MIIAFVVWLVALAAAAGYGQLLLPRSSDDESPEYEFARVFAGLLIISTILLAAAVFTSLTPIVGATVVFPGIALYWRHRPQNSRHRYYCVILAFVALFVSMREINFYDTALYHQQAVKWLAEHGLVRGVALVYFPLGFVSSWSAVAAPLDHGITAGRVGIVGGLPFILAVTAGLQIVGGFLSRLVASTTWAILGIMLSVVAVVWHVDASLSPDMMVWLLPLVIVTILMDPKATEAERIGRAMLIAAMACLIKPTAAPVFIYCFALVAWRSFRVAKERRKLAGFAALALGILALLIGANLTASGCPLFPSALGCTSLDWSVGTDAARSIQAEIQEFARDPRHHQIFPLTAAATLASVLLGATVRTVYVRHVLGVAWVGIALALIVAPSPRYGLGYMLLPVAALIAVALERARVGISRREDELSRWIKPSVTFAVLTAALIFVAATGDWSTLLYPRRIAAANGDPIHKVNRAFDARGLLAFNAEQRGELTIRVPVSSDQCWDAPLPCTPKLTRGDLRLRNKGSLDAGFLAPREGSQASR